MVNSLPPSRTSILVSASEPSTITRRTDGTPADDGVRAPTPRLVAAFECRRPCSPGLRLSLRDVDDVLVGRGSERTWWRAGRQLVLAIPDDEVSRLHVRLVRQGETWIMHDAGSKNGTRVNSSPTARRALADGDIIEVGRSLLVFRDRPGTASDLGDRDLSAEHAVPEVFRTLSLELERRALELGLIAPTGVPVLVVGETGTGKEMVARAIHALSGRTGPFVPINCGALPRSLVESELVGYRRGAFSGATDERAGLARRADRGTLFLDEVAELPEESQAALLRLLQEGEVRPLGSADIMRVDVRVVAATHQDIGTRMAEGRFRRDLYARLAGYEMAIPPLRERVEDIGSLVAALLSRLECAERGLRVHPSAARALMTHSFPMNVRELEQALASAVALASRGELGLVHLPPAIRDGARSSLEPPLQPKDAQLRAQLVELLRRNRGNVRATARALDKAPVQVRRWCHRFRIELPEFRDP